MIDKLAATVPSVVDVVVLGELDAQAVVTPGIFEHQVVRVPRTVTQADGNKAGAGGRDTGVGSWRAGRAGRRWRQRLRGVVGGVSGAASGTVFGVVAGAM